MQDLSLEYFPPRADARSPDRPLTFTPAVRRLLQVLLIWVAAWSFGSAIGVLRHHEAAAQPSSSVLCVKPEG